MKLKPENRERILRAARELHEDGSDDDVKINHDACINRSGARGMWVQAWVYISVETMKEKDL